MIEGSAMLCPRVGCCNCWLNSDCHWAARVSVPPPPPPAYSSPLGWNKPRRLEAGGKFGRRGGCPRKDSSSVAMELFGTEPGRRAPCTPPSTRRTRVLTAGCCSRCAWRESADNGAEEEEQDSMVRVEDDAGGTTENRGEN